MTLGFLGNTERETEALRSPSTSAPQLDALFIILFPPHPHVSLRAYTDPLPPANPWGHPGSTPASGPISFGAHSSPPLSRLFLQQEDGVTHSLYREGCCPDPHSARPSPRPKTPMQHAKLPLPLPRPPGSAGKRNLSARPPCRGGGRS